MKQTLFSAIDSMKEELWALADDIYDHPELGFNEHHALQSITGFLANRGFSAETGVGGVKTSFRWTYKNGTGGPRIGLLGEYDALEGIGHACGHHLQVPALLGAALSLIRHIPSEIPYTLVLYGTPAEEGQGGKILMCEHGCFADIDVAIMMHAGAETTVDPTTYANAIYTVTYQGKASHAAAHPHGGRSAFDAMLLTMTAIEYMREHMPEDCRIHYKPVHAGNTPANIVPETAQGEFVLRSRRNTYLTYLGTRFQDILRGACMMTDTSYTMEKGMGYKACIPNNTLIQLFYDNARQAQALRIEPPRTKTGSTDFGDVMQLVPGICVRIAFAPKGTGAHSQEWLELGKTRDAHRCIITAAKTVAGMASDLIQDPKLLEQVHQDYREETTQPQDSQNGGSAL